MKEILLQVSHGEEKKADIHTLLQHVSVTRKLEQIRSQVPKIKILFAHARFFTRCYVLRYWVTPAKCGKPHPVEHKDGGRAAHNSCLSLYPCDCLLFLFSKA